MSIINKNSGPPLSYPLQTTRDLRSARQNLSYCFRIEIKCARGGKCGGDVLSVVGPDERCAYLVSFSAFFYVERYAHMARSLLDLKNLHDRSLAPTKRPIAKTKSSQFIDQRSSVRIINMNDGALGIFRTDTKQLEEVALCTEVVLKGLVIIEMITSQIGEDTDIKLNILHSRLVQGVG
jgi:hypothetical protein